MSTYLTPSDAISFLPDSSSDTLFVIGFPTRTGTSSAPAVLAFPTADLATLYTPAIATHVRDQLTAGSDADVLIVVVGDGQDNHDRLPHRAAIAAIEAALRPAGHTVTGCYWTPHTQPGAHLRDYRNPRRITTIMPATTHIALAPPLRIMADTALPWGLPFTERGETIPARLGRFARTVLPLLVRYDDRTHDAVAQAVDDAARGELPDDENGFAVACALRDNATTRPTGHCSSRRPIWTSAGSSSCGWHCTAVPLTRPSGPSSPPSPQPVRCAGGPGTSPPSHSPTPPPHPARTPSGSCCINTPAAQPSMKNSST